MTKKVELRTLKPGKIFDQNGKRGILLSIDVNAQVMIFNLPDTEYYNNNESYYKGKHIWSASTLVTEVS